MIGWVLYAILASQSTQLKTLSEDSHADSLGTGRIGNKLRQLDAEEMRKYTSQCTA